MKLNFTLFVSAFASPRVVNVEDYTTRADQVLTGGFGTYLECPYGRVMRGTCTSGNDKDCRYNGTKYSHIVWCGENQEIAQDFASYCYWKTGDFQEIINCGSNELAMGLCSSSSRGDCARDAMESDCQWLFPQTYGAENFCPTDKYAAGTCGVGRWNTDYCSSYGKSGLKCCKPTK